jgi:autotransporter-associated beta strand protein
LTFNNSGYPAAVTVLGGTHSIASAVFLQGGNLDLTVSNHGDLKISGNISDDGGSRALVLLGDGTGELVLSGNNTYTGGTSVVGGTLVAASATALPNGSSLTVGQGASSLFAPSFAGPAVEAAPAGVAAVPEPGTLMLLLAALCGAVTCYRFSARSKAVQVG